MTTSPFPWFCGGKCLRLGNTKTEAALDLRVGGDGEHWINLVVITPLLSRSHPFVKTPLKHWTMIPVGKKFLLYSIGHPSLRNLNGESD